MKWMQHEIPMKVRDYWTDHVNQTTTLENNDKYGEDDNYILETKYEKVGTDCLSNEQSHLLAVQCDQLKQILGKQNKLFDGG